MKRITKPLPPARGPIVGAVLATGILAAGLSMLFLQTPSQAGTARSLNALVPSSGGNKPDSKPQARLVADKGKFRIMVSGQQVGKEEFEIGPNGSDWTAHGSSEIQSPQGNTHVSGTLTVHPDGTPAHYEWSTQGAKKASSAIAFSGTSATVELHLEGARPFTQQFTFTSPLVVVLDDNLYHQYAFLARLYDWDKKGRTDFFRPGAAGNDAGNRHRRFHGRPSINGKKVQELRVRTEDNEIDLFLDGPKLVRLVAPAANAEIIRE